MIIQPTAVFVGEAFICKVLYEIIQLEYLTGLHFPKLKTSLPGFLKTKIGLRLYFKIRNNFYLNLFNIKITIGYEDI